MRFVETRFKNVLSFGFDEEYVVPYETSTFNMVYGDNGVGKTNFTKLIEIGVYFVYPESVADVKNWYAKEDAYIEHTIESNGHVWKIKSVFTKKLKSITVHKDGEIQDWGNPSSVQRKIEEYVVDIPFSIFKNILCSSMDNVSSILKLNAKDSKEIVNQIFDISDIGLVGEYTSKHHFSKNKALSDKTVERETLETNLNSQKELFKEFKENDTEEEKKKLNSFKSELETATKNRDKFKIDLSIVTNKIKKVDKLILLDSKISLENVIEELKKNIDIDNDKIIESKSKLKFYEKTSKQRLLDKCIEDKSAEESNYKTIDVDKDKKESELKELSKLKDKKAILSLYSTIDTESKLKNNLEIDLEEKKKSFDLLDSEQKSLTIKKESSEKFDKYFKSLSEASAQAVKIKTVIQPNMATAKREKDLLEEEREKKNTTLSECKSELIELNKYILFMENPVCGVKGCGMDFSSPENAKLLEQSIEEKIKLDEKITSLGKDIDTIKTDIGKKDELLTKLKDELLTSVNFVKSFVKDDSFEDFRISFDDGVDLEAFKNKFSVTFSDDETERLNKVTTDFKSCESSINSLNESIDKSNKSIEFSKNTLLSSYGIDDDNSVKYSDEEKKAIEEYSDELRDSKIDDYNKVVKNLGDSKTKITVFEQKEKELKESIEAIGDIKEYEIEDDVELQSYVDVENVALTKLEQSVKDISKSETENSTKLDIVKNELKKYDDFDFDFQPKSDELLVDIKNALLSEKTVIDGDLEVLNTNITTIETNIKNIEESNSDEKYKVFDKAISEAEDNIKTVSDALSVLHEDFKCAELLKELYNMGWLKNELIGQVVGGINSIISEITEKYDIPVSCEFDSGFNSKLYKYGVETKYGMCSLGQRKMLSLISIISIVFYYKQVYPKINFIFLDEALSSLTEVNANKMIVVINDYLVSKLGMTVFISHHSFLKTSYFNNKYKLEEINVMTKVTVENDNG